jgi:hypothetical protein
MLQVGICSSHQSTKLTTAVLWCSNVVIVVSREDDEFHIHAFQIMTEHFQLCEQGHCHLAILHPCSEITSGSFDYPACPRTHLQ